MPKDVLSEIQEVVAGATKDFSKIADAVIKTETHTTEQLNSAILYLCTLMSLTNNLVKEVKKLRDRIDELERKPRPGFESKN